MQTVQVSTFKSQCLSLLKQVHDWREQIAVPFCGKTLALIQPAPRPPASPVGKWLEENRHLLVVEEELKLPLRETGADPMGLV